MSWSNSNAIFSLSPNELFVATTNFVTAVENLENNLFCKNIKTLIHKNCSLAQITAANNSFCCLGGCQRFRKFSRNLAGVLAQVVEQCPTSRKDLGSIFVVFTGSRANISPGKLWFYCYSVTEPKNLGLNPAGNAILEQV